MTDPRPDAERLLAEALRGHVGGPRNVRPAAGPAEPQGRGPDRFGRFTTAQVLLLAALIGLAIGMAVGLAVLLSR